MILASLQIDSHLSVQVEQQKQALVLRERSERAAQDSGALSELQEVLDRERGGADDLQVMKVAFPRFTEYFRTRICGTELSQPTMNMDHQVSLNDSETEREALGKRLHTAEAKANQFDQVAILKLRF